MIHQSSKGYVDFINGLKDGMKWDASKSDKYGVSPEQLVNSYGNSMGVAGLKTGAWKRRLAIRARFSAAAIHEFATLRSLGLRGSHLHGAQTKSRAARLLVLMPLLAMAVEVKPPIRIRLRCSTAARVIRGWTVVGYDEHRVSLMRDNTPSAHAWATSSRPRLRAVRALVGKPSARTMGVYRDVSTDAEPGRAVCRLGGSDVG